MNLFFRKQIFLGIFFISLIFFFSCQTPIYQKINNIKIGMYKYDVLEIIGSPSKVRRYNSIDTWIYKFFMDNEFKEFKVKFKEGRVIEILKFQIIRNKKKDKEIKEKKEKKENSFKPL